MRFWLGVGAGILTAWSIFAVAMHIEQRVYSGACSPTTPYERYRTGGITREEWAATLPSMIRDES